MLRIKVKAFGENEERTADGKRAGYLGQDRESYLLLPIHDISEVSRFMIVNDLKF